MKNFILFMAMICLLFLILGCGKDAPTELELKEDPDAAPNFTLTGIDNKNYTLRDYKGEVVVLNFFATWCVPCRSEIPELEAKVWQVYRDRGVVILGIDLRESSEKAKRLVSDMGITYPVIIDSTGEVGQLYEVHIIPYTFILDEAQHVQHTSLGYSPRSFDEMIKKIESLL